jgi:anaerobic ribonucleoside-triphosphate reductase
MCLQIYSILIELTTDSRGVHWQIDKKITRKSIGFSGYTTFFGIS